jgi:hypothetical protein
MTVTETPSPFGDIVFESIPEAPPRPPGKGREPVKWEDHLAPLESKLLNTPARLWAYENKAAATSRMSAVRSRLNTAVPQKNWELKVRPVPDTTLWGVYAVFHGDYTPEQVAENAAARQKRRDATVASRAAKTANGAVTPTQAAGSPENGNPAPMTPKEKLAAQAAAKAKA